MKSLQPTLIKSPKWDRNDITRISKASLLKIIGIETITLKGNKMTNLIEIWKQVKWFFPAKKVKEKETNATSLSLLCNYNAHYSKNWHEEKIMIRIGSFNYGHSHPLGKLISSSLFYKRIYLISLLCNLYPLNYWLLITVTWKIRLRWYGDSMSGHLFWRGFIDDILHLWMPRKIEALFIELLLANFVQINLQDFVYALMLFDQFLILAAALDRISGLDEPCHLFKYLQCPKYVKEYLLCSLLHMISLLK